MTVRIRLVMLIVILACLVMMALLVRRRAIRPRYLFMWTALCLMNVPVLAFPRLTDQFFYNIGIYYSPAGLLLIAVIVLFLVSVQFSREITRLEERVRSLAEEIALIRAAPPPPTRPAAPVGAASLAGHEVVD